MTSSSDSSSCDSQNASPFKHLRPESPWWPTCHPCLSMLKAQWYTWRFRDTKVPFFVKKCYIKTPQDLMVKFTLNMGYMSPSSLNIKEATYRLIADICRYIDIEWHRHHIDTDEVSSRPSRPQTPSTIHGFIMVSSRFWWPPTLRRITVSLSSLSTMEAQTRTRKLGHRAMESSATWQPSMELPNWHSGCLWKSVEVYVDILYCLWYFVDYNDYIWLQ